MRKLLLAKFVIANAVLALAAGILVISANASVGGASPLTTPGPDLISADLSGSVVTFCFDEELDEDEIDEDGDGLHVAGYNDEIVFEADEADGADEDDDCVDADFDDELRPSSATVAYVDADAVQDRLGTGNEIAAVPLTGSGADSDEGRTTGPDLDDFEVDDAANRVTFEYDERIDSATDRTHTAADFGVHQSNGDVYKGTTIVSVDTRSVVVGFGTQDVNSSTDRAFSLPEAVATEDTDSGDQSESSIGQVGEVTSNPDLDEAERRNDDSVRFYFDQDIDEGTGDDEPELFYAVAEDGISYEGDEANAGDDYVDVIFEDIDETEDYEIVAVGVAPAAVDAETGSNEDNTAGVIALEEPGVDEGLTDAPDIESARLNGTAVELTFDETVASAIPSKFLVLSTTGSTSAASGIAVSGGISTGTTPVESKTVSVVFPVSLLADAEGVILNPGAAQDYLTNESVTSSVPLTTSSTTSSTTSATTTTSSPATPICDREGVIRGSELSDVLRGTGQADVICALGGDDFVRGLGGADTIYLGDGNDVGEGGGGGDRIWGGIGNDIIRGGGGTDTLAGDEGTDSLTGGGDRDTCSTGENAGSKKTKKNC